jgi:hypothetical protein
MYVLLLSCNADNQFELFDGYVQIFLSDRAIPEETESRLNQLLIRLFNNFVLAMSNQGGYLYESGRTVTREYSEAIATAVVRARRMWGPNSVLAIRFETRLEEIQRLQRLQARERQEDADEAMDF